MIELVSSFDGIVTAIFGYLFFRLVEFNIDTYGLVRCRKEQEKEQ